MREAVHLSSVPAYLFLLFYAGYRLWYLPLWLDEANSQGLLVFLLSLIIHYGKEIEYGAVQAVI